MGFQSKRLTSALKDMEAWPIERQEAAADVLEHMSKSDMAPYKLSPEELSDIEEALEDVRRGEFATDDEVEAIFAPRGQ